MKCLIRADILVGISPSSHIVLSVVRGLTGRKKHVFFALFKHWDKFMIPRAEFRCRVWTRRYIHLRHHLNVVFTRYLQCRSSPVPPWRRGRSGPSSRLWTLSRYHLPYSSFFTADFCACVLSLLQKCLVWSCRCCSLPYFSIPFSSPRYALACYFLATVICWLLCPFVHMLRIFSFLLYWRWSCRTVPVTWLCDLTVCNGWCWQLLRLALRTSPYV